MTRPTGNPAGKPVKCERCPEDINKRATHSPCCSSHGVRLCCRHYRRTHFVEVGDCCDAYRLEREAAHRATAESLARVRGRKPLGDVLAEMEREDPAVGAAAASYDRTVERLVGKGPGLSHEEVKRIYEPGNEVD